MIDKLRKVSRSQSDRLYALADQALFGAGNLLTSLLLARILSVTDFAAYVSAVAVYFVIFGFHRALLVMPFLLSAKEEHDVLKKAQWVWMAVLFSAIAFIALQVSAFAMVRAHFATFACSVTWFAACQAPPLLLQEFGKRWLYQDGRGDAVVISSSISFVAILVGIGMIYFGLFPANWASAIIGASSAYGFLIQMQFLPPARVPPRWGEMRALLSPRLRFGIWQSLTHIPYVMYNQGFPLLLAQLGSPATIAGFSAIRNLLNPTNSIVSAVDATDKVRAIKAMRKRGMAGAFESTKGTRNVLLLMGLPFVILVGATGKWILPLAYKGRYTYPNELALLAVYFVFVMINQPFETFLTVNQRGKALFFSRTGSALVTLAMCVFLVPRLHVMGAVLSLLVAQVVNCALLATVSWRLLQANRSKPDRDSEPASDVAASAPAQSQLADAESVGMVDAESVGMA